MIYLPDFTKCIEFQKLRENMGIRTIPELPPVEFKRKVTKKVVVEEPNTKGIEFESRLKTESIPVSDNDIKVSQDGTLNIEGLKVAAYIRDQPRGIDYRKKYSKYRYHLCNCKTLQHMSSIGRGKRYLATKRTDGWFEVYDTSEYRERKLELKLDLCKNCIDELNYSGLWFSPFTLKGFFEKYDSKVPKTIRRIETVTKVQTYTPDHNDFAKEYKKAAEYKCQKCDVNCETNKSLLHLHHVDGDKSNNEHYNLRVFCIDCHSLEPMHRYMRNTSNAKRQIKEIKALRKVQGIIEFGLDI